VLSTACCHNGMGTEVPCNEKQGDAGMQAMLAEVREATHRVVLGGALVCLDPSGCTNHALANGAICPLSVVPPPCRVGSHHDGAVAACQLQWGPGGWASK